MFSGEIKSFLFDSSVVFDFVRREPLVTVITFIALKNSYLYIFNLPCLLCITYLND